jgi:cullin 3
VKQANVPSIYDTGLTLFRTQLIQNPDLRIGQHLISTILAHITLERQGYPIDRTSVKTNLEMLQQLFTENKDTVYGQDFEPLFMGESSKFYERESNEMLVVSDAGSYLIHVEKRLQEEYERSQHYLSPSTEPKIRRIVEKELIEAHMKSVAEVFIKFGKTNIEDGIRSEVYVNER